VWTLRLRAYLVATLIFGFFFALLYVVVFLIAPSTAYSPIPGLGASPFTGWFSWVVAVNFGLTFLVVFAQFWFSPRIIRWSARVQFVSEAEQPRLHAIVAELAQKAGVPKPQVGISDLPETNAFAYGRWNSDGHLCVTRSILGVLDEAELRSVLGHEISHLRHRDMVFMTLVQTVPLIAYIIARSLLRSRVRGKGAAYVLMVGAAAFAVYVVTTLLVLYVSRLRETYADQGSVELTGEKAPLASALYRITRGTAELDPNEVKELGGTRALMITDPYRAQKDARAFDWALVAPGGRFTEQSLLQFDEEVPKIPWHLRMAEVLSTHPLLEHRLKLLAEMPVGPSFQLYHANLRPRSGTRR
jgi:heat shock protein HtpX